MTTSTDHVPAHSPGSTTTSPWNAPTPSAPPPPIDPLAIASLVAALAVPPLGLALGIAAVRRTRRTGRRGYGPAVAGVVLGGLFTAFCGFVVAVLILGTVAAANTAGTSSGAPPAPVPVSDRPTAPPTAATTPEPVPTAQIEQQLALATGLPDGAITCPGPLPARVAAAETCRARVPGRGTADVVVTVTAVHGNDVDLHYDAGGTGT